MKGIKCRNVIIVVLGFVCLLSIASTALMIANVHFWNIAELQKYAYRPNLAAYTAEDQKRDTSFADYVFLGMVTKVLRVEQKKLPPGLFSYSTPETFYEVEILENLKGHLKLGLIEVKKLGGVAVKGLLLTLGTPTATIMNDDFLPETGDVCVFYANTQPDNTLSVSGAFSNILLDHVESDESGNVVAQAIGYHNNPEYLKALDACENEIPYERERFISVYDASNTD